MAGRQKTCLFLSLGLIQLMVAIVYCVASIYYLIKYNFPEINLNVFLLMIAVLYLITAILTCTSSMLTRPVMMSTLTFNIIAASITPILMAANIQYFEHPIVPSEDLMPEDIWIPYMVHISMGIFAFLAIVTASFCCTIVGCKSEPEKGPMVSMGMPNQMPYTGTVIITQ